MRFSLFFFSVLWDVYITPHLNQGASQSKWTGLSTFWFETRMDQNNEKLKYLTEPFFPTDSGYEVNYKHNLERKSMK